MRLLSRTWTWRRGFLSSVVADFATFAREVDSVADVPLERVELTGFRPEQRRTIMASGVHPTVRSFGLWANRLSGATIGVLASPLFSRARCVHLDGNDFSKPDAGRALAEFVMQSDSRSSAGSSTLSNEALRNLAAAPFFSKLTHLNRSFNRNLTLDGLQALREAKALRWVDVIGASIEVDRARLASLLPRGAQIRLVSDDPEFDLTNFAQA